MKSVFYLEFDYTGKQLTYTNKVVLNEITLYNNDARICLLNCFEALDKQTDRPFY